MPSLARKLVVFTAKDGLILQSQNSEHHNHHHHHHHHHRQAIKIDYRTRKVATTPSIEHHRLRSEIQLESHGVIGIINISSLYFLIVVTKREQVAQIHNRPIYAITDVAILPLASQTEAKEALSSVVNAAQDQEHDLSDCDDTESGDDQHSVTTEDPPTTPGVEDGPYTHQNKSNTSIAQNVAERKASYGKFASEWFYRQVWGSKSYRHDSQSSSAGHADTQSEAPVEKRETAPDATDATHDSRQDTTSLKPDFNSPGMVTNASALALLSKILKSIKMILSSRSFFFSYDIDLTRRSSFQDKRPPIISRDKLDPLYFWNRKLGSIFTDAGQDAFLMPIIQGFVGQRAFSVKPTAHVSGTHPARTEVIADDAGTEEDAGRGEDRNYLLTLISRRSTKRSGLRYLRRGIDDEGNCANTVETEQILSSPTWDKGSPIRSFVQIRGSIPLYFSQSPYSFKPTPMLHNSHSANEAAFKKHIQNLRTQYGAVQMIALVDKHGTEFSIGNAYENMYDHLHGSGLANDVDFEWFDFHAECRGMKFENVQKLVRQLEPKIDGWGQTIICDEKVEEVQKGVIRTNCMDCLDRTNVAQSAFGQLVLQDNLRKDGYEIDLLRDAGTSWFNTLWADNGDAISRQYASTAALKGDFTRTRKRNWRGQMNDLGLTLSRYYSNMVNDYFSQTIIDFLLGNVSWKIFEDFENTMMSVDPGISVESARQMAIENCAKIVISKSDEDLIHGWTMLTPAHTNTLRTLPFEEAVVLLTDAAVYCCKFDWNTEKLASYEKVDLRSISKIRRGTYITSTFTDRQLDDKINQGLVIVFSPGKGDVIRFNTRSLSNELSTESVDQPAVDGGTGILSWFAPKSTTAVSRTLALKVIPHNNDTEAESYQATKQRETTHDIAARVCEEIKRAVVGESHIEDYPHFVEVGDIISAAEARKRTGYLEQLSHSIKKMVWA